jgi:hypothetical protein
LPNGFGAIAIRIEDKQRVQLASQLLPTQQCGGFAGPVSGMRRAEMQRLDEMNHLARSAIELAQ